MASGARARSALADYTDVRTVPAVLSVGFVVAALYQFGGISQVTLPWLGYTLTTDHATLLALGAFAVAFASSETRQFEHYREWEQGIIALGPTVILGTQFVSAMHDLIVWIGDPLGFQVAFLLTLASWSVAVR